MYTTESNNASMSHAYSKPWPTVHRQKCNTEFRNQGDGVTPDPGDRYRVELLPA